MKVRTRMTILIIATICAVLVGYEFAEAVGLQTYTEGEIIHEVK